MADAIFRIPSRAVQYGYVEVTVPGVDASTNPESLAAQYVHYVYAFQKEEQAVVNRLQQNPVAASVAASQPVTEDQARRYLDEGLGGVSEVDGQDPEGPGEEPSGKPWDKAPEPAAKKPWESGNEPAKSGVTLDADW